ncbi:hypothetical protein CCR75_007502 [Bremia lactucae]|uniref:Reverse transcriptase/retrotransposon-derived protein RNase H-like domain-containing protein n=1 Tax=Bremia lactucae TaxID=4779 RepID=A0A976FNP7_BRELC|nr:hypothetical protein CCR75_007502 [Bremia lactucae]
MQDTHWDWGEDQQRAFNALKLALQQSPTLKLPDFNHLFVVTTDASGFCWEVFFLNAPTTTTHVIVLYSNLLDPHE